MRIRMSTGTTANEAGGAQGACVTYIGDVVREEMI